MFDLSPEEEWSDEPTEEEIRFIISQLKREIITTYKLQTVAGSSTKLVPAKSFCDCITDEDIQQNVFCTSARKCLEVTVATAKTLIPEKYFYLLNELLEEWLPIVH